MVSGVLVKRASPHIRVLSRAALGCVRMPQTEQRFSCYLRLNHARTRRRGFRLLVCHDDRYLFGGYHGRLGVTIDLVSQAKDASQRCRSCALVWALNRIGPSIMLGFMEKLLP